MLALRSFLILYTSNAMPSLFCTKLVSLVLLSAVSFLALAAPLPTEILVKYRNENGFTQSTGRPIGHGVFLVKPGNTTQFSSISSPSRLEQALQTLRSDSTVLYAEPNHIGHFADMPPTTTAPNDPSYIDQGWLEQIGARQAWAVATGKGITVAVVDSGIDLLHPDLKENLRTDGYNFGDGNANPQDEFGHGTFVAGIIAAQHNNAMGGSGLAPDTTILPIKINPSGQGSFTSAALAQGIDYAIAHGVRIINLSLYVDNATQTVGDAIQRALDAGGIVVIAAGNNGGPVAFPATYPGVIAVAGTNTDGSLSAGSNRGPEIVVAAPANQVSSTTIGGGFGSNGGGTSYSAPMVTATVAEMLQIDSRLNRDNLSKILKSTAQPLVNADSSFDFGLLDAGRTLLALLPDLQPSKASFSNAETLSLRYHLPSTAGPVDLYVALSTPMGELSLGPEGTWEPVTTGTYKALISGYQFTKAADGLLFGAGGSFPSITLAGIPAGSYTWKICLVNSSNGVLLGPVIKTPISIAK